MPASAGMTHFSLGPAQHSDPHKNSSLDLTGKHLGRTLVNEGTERALWRQHDLLLELSRLELILIHTDVVPASGYSVLEYESIFFIGMEKGGVPFWYSSS